MHGLVDRLIGVGLAIGEIRVREVHVRHPSLIHPVPREHRRVPELGAEQVVHRSLRNFEERTLRQPIFPIEEAVFPWESSSWFRRTACEIMYPETLWRRLAADSTLLTATAALLSLPPATLGDSVGWMGPAPEVMPLPQAIASASWICTKLST